MSAVDSLKPHWVINAIQAHVELISGQYVSERACFSLHNVKGTSQYFAVLTPENKTIDNKWIKVGYQASRNICPNLITLNETHIKWIQQLVTADACTHKIA